MNSNNRKLKIMHILNTASYSGAENVVITLINSLKNDLDCVYVSIDGSIREVLNKNNIVFYPVSKVSVINIRKAIRKIQPDIIHAHDFTAGVIAAASTFRIPIVNHLHNNPPWLKHITVNSVVYALSALRYKKILTVSKSVMGEFVFGRLFKNKTEIVGNPINVQAIRAKAVDAVITDAYDVIYLGRLSQQKNPLFFLDLVSALQNRVPNLRVAMIGNGEMREETRKRVECLSLQHTVWMYGFMENPYGILKNAKVLCMPSLWEGFGLAAVEALALGVPVVASSVGGLPEIIDEGCGGLFKIDNEKNVEDYVNEIEKLLSDGWYYKKKSDAATKKAEQLDNGQAYADKMRLMYSNLNRPK